MTLELIAMAAISVIAAPAPAPADPAHWDGLRDEHRVLAKIWTSPVQHPQEVHGRARHVPGEDKASVVASFDLERPPQLVGRWTGTWRLERRAARISASWEEPARGSSIRLSGPTTPRHGVVTLRGALKVAGVFSERTPIELDWSRVGSHGHLFTAYIMVPVLGRVRLLEARLTPSPAGHPLRPQEKL